VTAFVCAMPMEAKPLNAKLSLQKQSVGEVTLYAGALNGKPVVTIVTGMGTKLATDGLTRLLDAVEVERVFVVGITGAVENETPIGTLVCPEAVVDSATGAEHRPEQLGPGTPSGKMWTTDVLITDADQIAALRAKGVVSLDMETAALAAVCEARHIPWSVYRVISDRATDGTVNEEVFHLSNQDGTPRPAAVAKYFLTHPGQVPTMMRMAKEAKLATETAADAAIKACAAL
jgi:adenosylhomocysteine nucleosidase